MPKLLAPVLSPRKRRTSRQAKRDVVDHDNPIYCARDHDFIWLAGLIDAVQASGRDMGGLDAIVGFVLDVENGQIVGVN